MQTQLVCAHKGLVLLAVLFIEGAGRGRGGDLRVRPDSSLRRGFLYALLPSCCWPPAVTLLCSAADGPPPPGSTQEGFAFVIGEKGH